MHLMKTVSTTYTNNNNNNNRPIAMVQNVHASPSVIYNIIRSAKTAAIEPLALYWFKDHKHSVYNFNNLPQLNFFEVDKFERHDYIFLPYTTTATKYSLVLCNNK